MTKNLATFTLLTILVAGCNGGGSSDSNAVVSDAPFTVGGTVTTVRAKANRMAASITHVMAINPESSNPDRFLSPVAGDGSFSLTLDSNRPYVLVFLNNTFVGKNMIQGIFKASTLDSIAPVNGTNGNDASLGTISVDEGTQQATTSLDYNTLIARLGLDASTALTLGAIDDLSLRYANPDIDGNGVIDILEENQFGLDFHVRAINKLDAALLKMNDVVNQFAGVDSNDGAVFNADFNLSSIYALYKGTFDGTQCVPGGILDPSCAVTITPPGGIPNAPDSYSQLAFGEMNGFGPDYNMEMGSELPGSNGTPVEIVFDTGSHALTYTNVVTRTRASLTSEGTIVPFVRFNTSDETTTGHITSLQYKWMKAHVSGTVHWVPATAEEVSLIVGSSGAYMGMYISFTNSGARDHHVSFNIPQTASGTIPFTLDNSNDTDLTADQIAAITPNDYCNGALSYDDKLGLRIFAGAPQANDGVTVCP